MHAVGRSNVEKFFEGDTYGKNFICVQWKYWALANGGIFYEKSCQG